MHSKCYWQPMPRYSRSYNVPRYAEVIFYQQDRIILRLNLINELLHILPWPSVLTQQAVRLRGQDKKLKETDSINPHVIKTYINYFEVILDYHKRF